jgi:YidC/Oxa1 family membrane protein insertase
MEKRTLLAVGLALAVLIAWQIAFLGPQEAAYRARMAATRDSLRAQGETGAPAAPAPPTLAESPHAPTEVAALAAGMLAPVESGLAETPVTIETDRFRAVLSTRGARMTSFSLLGFPSPRGGVVDLVPTAGPGAFGVTLHTASGAVSLDDFVFAVDTAALTLTPGEAGAVTFSGEPLPGLRVTKRFSVRGGSYDWTLEVSTDGAAGAPSIAASTIDLGAGLALTEANTTEDHGFMAGAISEERAIHRKHLSRMKKDEALAWNGKIRWAALTNKYFIVGIAPQGNPPVELAMRREPDGSALGLEITVPHLRGAESGAALAVYAGPQDQRLLAASPIGLQDAVEYGWKVIQPLSLLLLKCLRLIHQLIPNYGIAIILVSAATKLAFYPLSHQSFKSMRDMQKIQTEVQALRERYKNDARRLNTETMALYKKHGVNPMGGCLPLLLQMPVFIALYNVLRRTIELRQAPFALWIHDLASPDVLFNLPVELPFLGRHMSALPILMGIATFYQQKMTTTDPRQKMLLYLMPIIMTVAFFQFPAGLVLYWLTNTLLTIAQQALIERKERATAVAKAA